jgi:undecaprenyl-diphosphatase
VAHRELSKQEIQMIEEILRITCLAILQGVTEFLPVSSSGHLMLGERLLGMEHDAVLVAVVLHAGTLVAVLMVYWRDLLDLFRPEQRRLLLQVMAATVMVGVVGLTLEVLDVENLIFNRTLLIPGIGFLVTAALLRFGLSRQAQQVPLDRIPWSVALRIGLFQVLAVLPGISRSGATISTGLRNRMRRDDAAAFSFLLMVPAVLGVAGVKLLTVIFSEPGTHVVPIPALAVGFVVSAVIGFAAINTLLKSVRRGDFRAYSWYCLALGIITIGVELWHWFGPVAES